MDLAVSAAEKAMETVWGLNMPGPQRGELLLKLANLIDQNKEELAALEALDNGKQSCLYKRDSGSRRIPSGKAYMMALHGDMPMCVSTLKYFAGWADKIHGQTLEVCVHVCRPPPKV